MKQTLSEKLLEFCHTYKGEKENPNMRPGAKIAWEWERNAIQWIRLVCRKYSAYLNLDFFRKKKWDILTIETYIACAVPDISREIRLNKGEYHVRDGEYFYDAFYADDKTWREARESRFQVDKGGVTLNHNQ